MNPPKSTSADAGSLSGNLGRLLLLSALVGVISGFGAIGFFGLLEVSRHFFLDMLVGYHPASPSGEAALLPGAGSELRRWVLLIVPALGGLLSGLLVYGLAPEAAGHGTDAAIDAYHYHQGAIRARVPLVKAVSAAITIGSGGSGGREGPIAQIGAGFGSLVAARLRLSPSDRRRLMAAGMAAGIGAIFHAPLAGALFAAEVLYRDMDIEHEVLVPAFISSIVAYSIFALAFGWSPVFTTPEYVFQEPLQLIPYAVLAVVVALCAILFIHLFYWVHNFSKKIELPNYLKPAIGGLIVGLIAFRLPYDALEVIGTGYGIIQKAFDGFDGGRIGIGILLIVAFGKMATTSFSIGTGGSGGVFGPSIVIGGALGGVVGLAAEALLPNMGIDPGAFVLVGMAGFFAAAANCPISTIIMVSEMTGNYQLLVPSMLVCVLAYLIARGHALYETQLESRLDAPSKMGNMMSAVLRKIRVREAVEQNGGRAAQAMITFREEMKLSDILVRFSETDQISFPIIDEAGKLNGMIDGRDVRRMIGEEGVAVLVVARDIARPPVTLTLDDTLLSAVQKMALSDAEELIIVDPADPQRPVATLSHHRVVRAYDKALFSAQV